MKRVLLITALIGAGIGLGGCPAITPPLNSTDKVGQLVYYAKVACQFEPTVALATSLINAAVGATVSTIGDRLCGAVTSIPQADGGTRNVKVYGVRVKIGVNGKFVR